MSGVLIVLASIHAKSGHNKLALEFYKNAIPLATNGSFGTNILNAFNGIAKIYLSEGKADSAIYYSNQVLQKWGKTHPVEMLPAATLLANIYESKNLKDSALKYLKLAISLNDSLFNQQRTREAQSFAFDKQLQQQELVAQQQENDSKLRQYVLLAFMLILLLIAFFFFRSNRLKQKANVLLNEQKEKVESTLSELKSTQQQLIQSEKMASLGELTAGIAHEIQNPLNFVNNFSEVNRELIAEMKEEIDKGNYDEVKLIATDVEENEQKILQHGKRADAIVKGMLQHSRKSEGKKEPTDINALCDEYLRLSYHGLRAKDKNFNAEIKTYFDTSLPKINVAPQDIGRVLLNLFNNAFYAVRERQKAEGERYEPTVSIHTKRVDGEVEIYVRDNGIGIPQNIIDKIFQPFFTTKPTGQGTGLGLSLSYDIMKAHGGEIRVESKEGEGSEFVIRLPAV
ncbi:MAG: ATP-binding protein [Ilyomonas sp.]